MNSSHLDLKREINVNAPVTSVALSVNGQHLAAASELGVSVFATFTGEALLSYPGDGDTLPVQKITASLMMDRLYVVTRSGIVAQLDLTRGDTDEWTFDARTFYNATVKIKKKDRVDEVYDLYSLSLADDGSLLALGHHSPGLTMLKTNGDLVWRRHTNSGNATEGQGWSVTFAPGGNTLYMASSGVGVNRIAVVEAINQSVSGGIILPPDVRVIQIAPLANNAGLATLQNKGRSDRRLVVYSADLNQVIWERQYYHPVTALAANRELPESHNALPLLVISQGVEGKITVLDALNGKELAERTLRTMINDLDFTQGATIAAASQDGKVFSIAYVSAKGFVL